MSNDTLPLSPFEERNAPGGVYDTCFENFNRDNDSLSQLKYYADFIGETNPWPPHRLITRFIRPSNYENDLLVMLFGEVLDEKEGTGLGARGGSVLKRPFVSFLMLCYIYLC